MGRRKANIHLTAERTAAELIKSSPMGIRQTPKGKIMSPVPAGPPICFLPQYPSRLSMFGADIHHNMIGFHGRATRRPVRTGDSSQA